MWISEQLRRQITWAKFQSTSSNVTRSHTNRHKLKLIEFQHEFRRAGVTGFDWPEYYPTFD